MTAAAPADAQRTTLPGWVARTAVALALLSVASSVLGLLRDLLIASLFGASAQTDAYVLAWTVPETATPLLTEGAMALVLVPLFARALQQRGSLAEIVARTALPLFVALGLLTAALALAAPALISAFTPGLADSSLAVRSLRASSLTVLFLGASGYVIAGLRARGSFLLPAAIYFAYNIGIVTCVLALHRSEGIFSAVLGLVVGSALMVLVPLPAFIRGTGRWMRPRLQMRELSIFAAFLPVGAYTLARQAQVLVERVVGSGLAPGSISQLSYASRVAQVPMLLSITAATIALPALAKAAGRGAAAERARRARHELELATVLVVPAVAFLVVTAPVCVQLLFERGHFSGQDAARTTEAMRVYALGLPGQSITAVAVIAFFSAIRVTWFPALALSGCLALTAAVDLAVASRLGVSGLAAGNAVGISVGALLLLGGLSRQLPALELPRFRRHLLRTVVAGAGAALPAVVVLRVAADAPSVVRLVVGGLVVMTTYTLIGAALGVEPVRDAAGAVWERLAPRAVMYHSVGLLAEDPHQLVVSSERLDLQLRRLRRLGLRCVSLRELQEARTNGRARGLVGLSFDDGYRDFLHDAIPVLVAHSCTATVFVVSGRIGSVNDWDSGPVLPLMSAVEIRQVEAAGFEIGSHSHSHVDLRGLPPDQLERQVRGSKEELEELLGSRVVGFSYPYGHRDAAAEQAVKRAGYAYAAAVRGSGSSAYAVPRAYLGEGDVGLRLLVKTVLLRLSASRNRGRASRTASTAR